MRPVDSMVMGGLLYIVLDDGSGNLLGVSGTIEDIQLTFLRSYEPLWNQSQVQGHMRLRLHQFVVKSLATWRDDIPGRTQIAPQPRRLPASEPLRLGYDDTDLS